MDIRNALLAKGHDSAILYAVGVRSKGEIQ
jgi:hypothetical protein